MMTSRRLNMSSGWPWLALGAALALPVPSIAQAPSDAQAYCTGITDPAREARFNWQASTLKALEAKLQGTMAELEVKKAAFQKMVDEREAVLKRVEDQVVQIFSRMRPEAAATQLATMDQQLAAALLAKLAPRTASAVLNEMEAARAAQLTETLTGIVGRSATGASFQ